MMTKTGSIPGLVDADYKQASKYLANRTNEIIVKETNRVLEQMMEWAGTFWGKLR